jgi:hypothetical protein
LNKDRTDVNWLPRRGAIAIDTKVYGLCPRA